MIQHVVEQIKANMVRCRQLAINARNCRNWVVEEKHTASADAFELSLTIIGTYFPETVATTSNTEPQTK
jgi:hypothetical protein